jgi:hypothetical protein
MKQLIIICLTLLALTFKAEAADYNDIARCKLADASIEMDVFVTVSNSSEGDTVIRVERVYQADSSVTTHIVKMQDATNFVGAGIVLTPDFANQLPQGGFKTVMKMENSGVVSQENLSCFPVYQNPQINYSL